MAERPPRPAAEASEPIFDEPLEVGFRGSASPAAPHPAESDSPPVRVREVFAVVLMVVMADLTVFRGHGFAGHAAALVFAPLLLLLGAPRPRVRGGLLLVGFMLCLLGAALIWCGDALQVAAGLVLIVAFAMLLAGLRPYVLDILVYAAQCTAAGVLGLVQYGQSLDRLSKPVPRAGWLKVVLPTVAVVSFGTLFVLANPDLASTVSRMLGDWSRSFWEGLMRFAPTAPEVFFWGAVAWITIGLLRPMMRRELFDGMMPEAEHRAELPRAEAPLYAAFRNTLLAVIVLFAVYLAFEFATLWFREFPEGFHYSGYAHEGAAWLTLALALATVILSAIFRAHVLRDARLPALRRLAWIWSAENILLALAVYNRMLIYIDFNGMTRMRTVALFGITTVVVGFALVVWKISAGRGFVWLVRSQLWALAIAVYLLAVTPVDMLIHSYNVRRILAGDPAPSVQITEHPIDSGGVLMLQPLVRAEDPIIREGIRALLAERALKLDNLMRLRKTQGWTSFQAADQRLHSELQRTREHWSEYTAPDKRHRALERFREYAYQWY